MTAKLPECYQASTLSRMNYGDHGWTLPWGMWVDEDRECWLHPDYPVLDRPHGTVSMLVKLEAGGYHVWPPAGQDWTPSSEPGFFPPTPGMTFLPVAEIHDA